MSFIYSGEGQFQSRPFEWEVREFVYSKEPTAGDIASLVWEEGLDDHNLSIKSELVSNTGITYGVNNYKWTVSFRKRVNA